MRVPSCGIHGTSSSGPNDPVGGPKFGSKFRQYTGCAITPSKSSKATGPTAAAGFESLSSPGGSVTMFAFPWAKSDATALFLSFDQWPCHREHRGPNDRSFRACRAPSATVAEGKLLKSSCRNAPPATATQAERQSGVGPFNCYREVIAGQGRSVAIAMFFRRISCDPVRNVLRSHVILLIHRSH